ncbi:MAG: hypothetical protein ABL984_09495 [Pyrinomonadaceae bacterium]
MRESLTKNPSLIALATAVVYYFSNPKPNHFYDYTFRVADGFLRGSIGFSEKPPNWLNEFVPFDGLWYSVFPLGAVVSMVPFALLRAVGIINEMPAALICALLAGLICLFLLKIGSKYDVPFSRVLLLACGILFGTFMWTNLTFGGAWQLALGFAMVGELGAIYFTVYDRRPLIAGAFFALAFGNRTEILLTAPIFFYLLMRKAEPPASAGGGNSTDGQDGVSSTIRSRQAASNAPVRVGSGAEISPLAYAGGSAFRATAAFCIVPFILGFSTLVYNYVRFHSFTDFGYARIPGVLNEPWYNHGIFSIWYIPRQAWEMLLKLWEMKSAFPYLVPNGFSSSILISSPFILFAFRFGSRDRVLKYCAWTAIAIMTVLLWMHGNSGGWQFGYRYWMVCLPWLLVILLESSPKSISPLEWAAYIFSFIANLYATWLFHWTTYLRP